MAAGQASAPARAATTLDFSIVVPSYARPQQLATALAALARQAWPIERYEIIVVDDGSPGGASAPAPTIPNLRVLRQSHQGPAAARNRGALHARGRFLAFTDDDCEPEPTWLSAWAQAFKGDPSALLGGHTVNGLPHNPYSIASAQLLDYLYQYYNRGGPTFFASSNIAMPAALFWKIGGFDIGFPLAAGEDRDFCRRWRATGYPLRYVADAVVRHAHPLKLGSFCRQHFNYGRGAARFHQLSPQRTEPLSFYVNLVRHPLRTGLSTRGWRQAMLMGISQLAVAGGFLWEARRR